MIGNPITTMSIGLRWHLDGNVCAQPVCLLPSFLPLSRFASCCFCQHTRKNVSEGESFSTCTAHSYLTAGEDLLDFSLTVDSSKYSYSCFSYSFFSGKLFYWCLSLLAVVFLTLLIAIISQLLMIAGDIESNPGPKRGSENDIKYFSSISHAHTHTPTYIHTHTHARTYRFCMYVWV